MKKSKITLSDDIINFINMFNKIQTSTVDSNGDKTTSEISWINCYFKSTEEYNVFEVLTEVDLINHYCKSNENTDKGISSITKKHNIKYESEDNIK